MHNFYKLFSILDKWKHYYFGAALLLIFSTFIRMLEPKVLQVTIDGVIVYFQSNGTQQATTNDTFAQWIYNIIPDLTMGNLVWVLLCLGLVYLGIAFFRGASMFASSAISSYCTEKAIKQFRDKLFAHLQKVPLTFHATTSTGEIIQKSTGDVETVRRFMLNQVVDVILLSSIFVFSFWMMASVHLTYSLIAIASVPIVVGTSYIFFRKEQKVWEKHEAEQDKLTGIAEENLSGIRVVQAFAQEDSEIEKFESQNQRKLTIGKKHAMLHAFFWPFSDTMIHFQIAASIMAGGYYALTNQITVGELTSFYTYAIMVTFPMRRLGRVVSQMGMAMVAMERISKIMDEPEEDYSGIEGGGLKGEIVFKNVWFQYPDAKENEYVLQDVSFKIAAGQQVALMGPTGAGKTTIIALLTRFFEPTKGEIFLDGKSLQLYSKTYLRKQIGLVLQKAFLFSTTIKGNIAYTQTRVDEDEIIDAAKAASIHDIMHVFPEGYDTLVGEKGVTLSGGQKQRVTLARTLLESTDILVLDDATSAVDTETEYNIQMSLKEKVKDKTTIIIAHRITSVQRADKIIVIEKGKVTAEGNHLELSKKPGFYRNVYEVQAEMEAELL
ncbi:MAG: ABC transporter ATP-binding protein [Chitinophagales bacterium]